MKIQVEQDVFDDPEFCATTAGECNFLDSDCHCIIFDISPVEGFTTTDGIDHDQVFIKCDACKAAYQAAIDAKAYKLQPRIT